MKLSGDYSIDELKRALQGNFSCMEFTKDSHGHALPEDRQYIRLELFFIAIEFYPHKGEVVVSKLKDDVTGGTSLRKIITLKGDVTDRN